MTNDYTRNTSIPENPDNWNRIADKKPPEGVTVRVGRDGHLADLIMGDDGDDYWLYQDGRLIKVHPDDEWRLYEAAGK